MEKSNRICRTCLKSSLTMVPLFKDTSLCRKILTISSVVVSPEANLPSNVCVECVNNINSAFKFRQVLINSAARLKTAGIKNSERRLDIQDTRDPLALSFKDNDNEPSPKQESVINLEDSTPVTTFTIDFNPFREESVQNNDLALEKLLNHESAVLPSNVTKFLDLASKGTSSPVIHHAHCGTIKTEPNVDLSEDHQPADTVNESSIDSPKSSLSPVNHNAHNEEECYGTIKMEANVTLLEEHQPAPPVNTSRVKRRVRRPYAIKKDLLCHFCGKLFGNTNFTQHVLNHTEDPVNCTVCGKAVKNILHLRFHMKAHGPPVRICGYCDKPFTHYSNYVRHVNDVHTANRKYQCSICVKRFTDNSALRKHMQTHSGERPYPCKDCKKSFTSNYALKIHVRQHTNEKPYTCDYCSMGFPQKISLTRHLKSKHNELITA